MADAYDDNYNYDDNPEHNYNDNNDTKYRVLQTRYDLASVRIMLL